MFKERVFPCEYISVYKHSGTRREHHSKLVLDYKLVTTVNCFKLVPFIMKLFGLVVLVMALLALMTGGASASPKGIGGALRKGGKVIVSTKR